jgi:hypothetical protein
VFVLLLIGIPATILVWRYPYRPSGVGVEYDRQEYVVITRPHLKYHVDVAHGFCFAESKSGSLVEFSCTDSIVELAKKGVKPFDKR